MNEEKIEKCPTLVLSNVQDAVKLNERSKPRWAYQRLYLKADEKKNRFSFFSYLKMSMFAYNNSKDMTIETFIVSLPVNMTVLSII